MKTIPYPLLFSQRVKSLKFLIPTMAAQHLMWISLMVSFYLSRYYERPYSSFYQYFLLLAAASMFFNYLFLMYFYRYFFSPLRGVPHPKVSSWWIIIIAC